MNNSNDCVKKCIVLLPPVHPWCCVHVLCITTLANQYRDMIQFYELTLLLIITQTLILDIPSSL